MMKEEFENLAGYEVSWEDYTKVIEPMYMAVDISKEEFVRTLSKKRFALKTKKQYIKEMKRIAHQLRETCEHYTDYELLNKLDDLAESCTSRCGYSHYYMNTRYTLEHLGECRGCTYPCSLVMMTEKGISSETVEFF